MPLEIKLRESGDRRSARRLKRKLDRENIIKDVRNKRYFEKPCEVRRRKEGGSIFRILAPQARERLTLTVNGAVRLG